MAQSLSPTGSPMYQRDSDGDRADGPSSLRRLAGTGRRWSRTRSSTSGPVARLTRDGAQTSPVPPSAPVQESTSRAQ